MIDKTTTTTTTKKEVEKDLMEGIELNYHASIRFEKKDKVIYFDPYKISNTNNDADYIFITHSHYDHYSSEDILKVMKDSTKFIITSDLKSKIMNLGVLEDNIITVSPNETKTVDDLMFEVIPSYNTNKNYHKKSYNWVGYNLTIDDIKYYIVGDSDVTEEFKNVNCDVIFVPVGGTYTMTSLEALNAINNMNVKIAVPIHYGEVGSKDDALEFTKNLNDNIKGVILN